jgi:hypothetical protein
MNPGSQKDEFVRQRLESWQKVGSFAVALTIVDRDLTTAAPASCYFNFKGNGIQKRRSGNELVYLRCAERRNHFAWAGSCFPPFCRNGGKVSRDKLESPAGCSV